MEIKYKKLVSFVLGICFTIGLSAQDSTYSFSMQQCIDYAKVNHPQIKMGNADVIIAKADVKDVMAMGLPQVNIGANFNHNLKIATQVLPDFISPSVYGVLYGERVLNPATNPPPNFGATPVQFGVPYSVTANATLSQLIFDGTYFLGLKAANQYVNMSKLQAEKSAIDIVENVSKSYLLILTTQENKKLVEDNLIVINATIKEMKALLANGFAEKLDVERLELSQSSLEIRAKSISQQVVILQQSLKFNMGMPVNYTLNLTDSIKGIMAQSNLMTAANFDISQIQDYKILSQNQVLQEMNKDRNIVGRYPTVRLNANYGQQSFATKNDFNSLGSEWFPLSSYTVAVNVPIWDGNARRAKIIKAEQNITKNELMMQNLANAATLQFNSAQVRYSTSLELMDLQQKNLQIASEIYKKAAIKLKEGLGSSLELVQAETDYKAAQISYLNSIYDVLLANVELKKSLGQLK